jgi:glycosyltransferase involved in cell wall biosynthesis
MKCALIGPTYPFRGGISHYTTLLCQNLRQRHEVDFYTFTRQYPSFLFPGQTDRDPSNKPLCCDATPLIDPVNPLSWVKAAGRVSRREPDILIMQWWVPYWAPAFATIAFLVRRSTGIRILFICHNVLPHERRRVDRLLAGLTLGNGHSFMVHSYRDEMQLRAMLPGARITRTELPACDFFNRCGLSQDSAKKQLNLSGKKVLLFFGFVRPYKGVEYAISAMPQILEEVDAHLLVVGEFWSPESDFRALINRLAVSSAVTIVNRYVPNEEVAPYFAAADLVVLPYLDATQSAVIPIAYGFERPVLTTAVGGLGEAVKDGRTGFLVPPGDSEALAQMVVRFFREELGQQLAANIRAEHQRLSWEETVRLIESLVVPDGKGSAA